MDKFDTQRIAFPKPQKPLAFTGERFVPGLGGEIECEHHHRYLFALEFCRGKRVLDVGSGEGYGTALLASVAGHVTGVDLDCAAVAHANTCYGCAKIAYVAGSASKLPIRTASIDVVVSFEVVAHLAEQDAYLSEIQRVLTANGLFIASSPIRENYSPGGATNNPFHVKELEKQDFIELIRDRFGSGAFYIQQAVAGSFMQRMWAAGGSATPALRVFEKIGDASYDCSAELARPLYVVAVAGKQSEEWPSPAAALLTNAHYLAALRQRIVGEEAATIEPQTSLAQVCEELQRARVALNVESTTRHQLERQLSLVKAISGRVAAQLRSAQNQHHSSPDPALLEAQDALATIRNSTSWRITGPLRQAVRLGRKLLAVLRGDYLAYLASLPRPELINTSALRRSVAVFGGLPDLALDLVQHGPRRFPTATARNVLFGPEPEVDTASRAAASAEDLPGDTDIQAPPEKFEHKNLFADERERAFLAFLTEKVLAFVAEHGPCRVLIAINFFAGGGAEHVTASLMGEVAKHVSSAIIVQTDFGPRAEIPELPANVLCLDLAEPVPTPDAETRTARLFSLLRMIEPAYLHIVNSAIAWSLLARLPQAFLPSTTFSASVFSLQLDSDGRPRGYAREFLPLAGGRLSQVLTDNACFAKDVADALDLPFLRKKVHVLHTPCRLEREVREADGRARLEQRVEQLFANRMIIIWAGRLDLEKRLDLLLDIASLTTECCDFRVFGSAVLDRDDPYQALLQGELAGLPNVAIRGAFSTHLEWDSPTPAHALLFTSSWEGMPNTLIEAAWLGFPVVATAVGGVSGLIDEVTGWPVPRFASAQAYLDALADIKHRREEARARTIRLIERAHEQHSAARFARDLRASDAFGLGS